jgi:CRISPR system Cascade subunit CasC
MAKIVEIHLLQNFAPSNLNRDDTGAPKDAVFGSVRRARISSQCVKRAARLHFARADLLGETELATRTRNVAAQIADLLNQKGISDCEKAIINAFAELKLKLKKKKDEGQLQSEFLLFLGHREIAQLTDVIAQFFDEFTKGKPSREAKAALEDCIGSPAVDVALFGRMLANRKDFNVDAACQVAHAISTHKVDRDVDFFTAVDDFVQSDEAVSGMLGTVEFNSSCYYRYAVVNLDLMASNLGNDREMAAKGVRAFVQAAVEAVPSGKQNTFAAHNPPAFIAISVREGMPMNLANAFEKPVQSSEHPGGLTAASVSRLQDTFQRYAGAYGVTQPLVALDLTSAWKGEQVSTLASLLDELATKVASAYGLPA